MLLAERRLQCAIAHKGPPTPIQATKRWPVERTHAWRNNFYKLTRCTQRRQIVADFYIAFCQHRRAGPQTPTPSLDPLPLGHPTPPPALTYWRTLLITIQEGVLITINRTGNSPHLLGFSRS